MIDLIPRKITKFFSKKSGLLRYSHDISYPVEKKYLELKAKKHIQNALNYLKDFFFL